MEHKIYRQGQRFLRDILPSLRAEALRAGSSLQTKALSTIAEAMMPYVTEDNLDALVIYPAPLGGWHADLCLRDVPMGVANRVGTRVEQPCRTRDDAVAAGKALVKYAVIIAQRNATATDRPPPCFILYGTSINLMSDMYEAVLSKFPETKQSLTKENALQCLVSVLAQLFGADHGAVAAADIRALSLDNLAKLLSAVHMAAFAGLLRYPVRQPASPSGHRASATHH